MTKQKRVCRKWVAAIMVVGCFAACASAQMTVKQQQPTEPLAVESREQEPLAASEAGVRNDLRLHPDSTQALYQLGLVLRLEDKPAESLKTYTQAAQRQEPNAEQLRSVALDYVLLNDYPDAIHWLERAAALDSGNVEVLYSLARCFYTQGQYHQAEVLYLRVLQINPEHLKAEENLGLAYDAEDEPEKAEKALRTSVVWAARQPTNEWPFLNLGSFLLDHDRAVEAVPSLQNAVAHAPGSAICHEKLGRALEESGKVPEGVRELETAVHLDPRNPNIHFELGHAYRKMGAMEKARAEFAASQQLRNERDRK
jgi:tetratricopeptide (TPR) repeat protein